MGRTAPLVRQWRLSSPCGRTYFLHGFVDTQILKLLLIWRNSVSVVILIRTQGLRCQGILESYVLSVRRLLLWLIKQLTVTCAQIGVTLDVEKFRHLNIRNCKVCNMPKMFSDLRSLPFAEISYLDLDLDSSDYSSFDDNHNDGMSSIKSL